MDMFTLKIVKNFLMVAASAALVLSCGVQRPNGSHTANLGGSGEALGKITGFDSNLNLRGAVCQANAGDGVSIQVYIGNEAGKNGANLVTEIKSNVPSDAADTVFLYQCASIGPSFSFAVSSQQLVQFSGNRVFVYVKSLRNPGQLIKLSSSEDLRIPDAASSSQTPVTTTTRAPVMNTSSTLAQRQHLHPLQQRLLRAPPQQRLHYHQQQRLPHFHLRQRLPHFHLRQRLRLGHPQQRLHCHPQQRLQLLLLCLLDFQFLISTVKE